MATEMGEYAVGAYLALIEKCDVVSYNVRRPGGKLAGLNELDVVGLRFKDKTAYLCEVATHIKGVLYKDNKTTVERVKKKFRVQKEYAARHLRSFPRRHFMFWSPVVPKGYLTEHLGKISDLELIINQDYAARIADLKKLAHEQSHETNNPFFRVLQILEHLRYAKNQSESHSR